MVYNNSSDFSNDEAGKIVYDLRQTYAKLAGLHMTDICIARKERNYPNYFTGLEDLYIVVSCYIEDEEDRAEYKKLRDTVIKCANEYRQTWEGKINDKMEIIREALAQMEMFLYRVMKENSLFGNKWDDEGL
jgi:hypothetical protein